MLESNIQNIANYLRENHLMLNSSKTEFVCFSKQNVQRNKTQDTVLIDIKVIKKSNDCKYIGLTTDSRLSFLNHVKQTLKKMSQWIQKKDSIGTQLPTSGLEISLHSNILSHLNYSVLFNQHIRNLKINSLEKQLNWGLKKVFFCSKCKSSRRLRIENRWSALNRDLINFLLFIS